VDDTTRCQLVVLNSTSKLHLNPTLTPLLNSSHQLGEIWVQKLNLNLTFWIPVFTESGWKLGVQISTLKLHFNMTKTPLLKSTYQWVKSGCINSTFWIQYFSSQQLGEIWVHKLNLNWTFWIQYFPSHQLGEMWVHKLNLDFLNPSFYQVRVKTRSSNIHFKTPLQLDLNSTVEIHLSTGLNLGA